MVDRNGIRVLQHKKHIVRKLVQPETLRQEPLTERDLYRRQNGKCFYCLDPLDPAAHSMKYPEGWTRDHFFPASYGNDLAGNMVLACKLCNSGKSSDAPSAKEIKKFKMLYAGDNLSALFGKGACK